MRQTNTFNLQYTKTLQKMLRDQIRKNFTKNKKDKK